MSHDTTITVPVVNKRRMDRMWNPINVEQYKGTKQMKIMEQETEQMEIVMNPHGTIVYAQPEQTHEIKHGMDT